jgi:hypothetical protein
MEYVRFGNTGMKVSRICLGCMSYGKSAEGRRWELDEEQSRPYFRRALEMGINFFDTADVYSRRSLPAPPCNRFYVARTGNIGHKRRRSASVEPTGDLATCFNVSGSIGIRSISAKMKPRLSK